MPSPSTRVAPPVRLPALAWIGLLAIAAVFTAACWHWRFLVDDSWINFRFSLNVATGHGPVFNWGERVEGYTTPLWVIGLGALGALGLPIGDTGHVVDIACGAATVILAGAIAGRRTSTTPVWVAWCAALLVALNPGMVFWSGSGMETPVFTLAVLLAVYAADQPNVGIGAGALAGVMILARPEGMLLTALLGVLVLARAGVGAAVRFGLGVALVFGPFELFRVLYYGDVLPNTYYCKVGLQVGHGWWYLKQFVVDGGWLYALAAVAIAAGVGGTRGWALLLGPYLVYVVAVGGDFFAFHRFVVPCVPLLAIATAWGLERIVPGERGAALAVVVLLAWIAIQRPAYAYLVRAMPQTDGLSRLNERRGHVFGELPPGTVVAMSPIGAIPFAAGPGITVIDMLGKTDAYIAHHGRRVDGGLPAHSRYDNDYILSRKPDLILVVCPKAGPMLPLLAAAVRDDPCGVAMGEVGLETGLYHRDCSGVATSRLPYCLPGEMDLTAGSHRAAFEALYEPAVDIPHIGTIPSAFKRRDWTPVWPSPPAS